MWAPELMGPVGLVDCAAFTGCTDRRLGHPEDRGTGGRASVCPFRNAWNNQLRTGADKGNPTV